MLAQEVAVEPVEGDAADIHDGTAFIIQEPNSSPAGPGDLASLQELSDDDLLLMCHFGRFFV